MLTIDRFRDSFFEVHSLEKLDRTKLVAALLENSFAVIRGLISATDIRQSIALLKNRFHRNQDHPSSGDTPSQIQTNFQKLIVGGKHQSKADVYCARFFRTFYNPLWCDDIYGMRKSLLTLCRVRNLLLDKPKDYATFDIEPNGMWSAARIHQFPRGGGFFQAHRDVILIDLAKAKGIEFFQPMIKMSQRGIDYEKGGAFAEIKGQRVDVEDGYEVGDIIIYSEANWHGVDDIDPHLPLDLNTINGRLTAFVTLYEDWTKRANA